MKKYALIVAAGSGTRMGTEKPKQFLTIAGKPLLTYTLDTFIEAFDDIEIILVINVDRFADGNTVILNSTRPDRIKLVKGSTTRPESVRAGLDHVPDNAIVFIHDGVRCLLSTALIHRCYAGAVEKGNAVPAITAVDSVRIAVGDTNKMVDRNTVKLVQTPQTFRSELIKAAYRNVTAENLSDDASVAETMGIKINIVEGERDNLKITHPADLLIAEAIINRK